MALLGQPAPKSLILLTCVFWWFCHLFFKPYIGPPQLLWFYILDIFQQWWFQNFYPEQGWEQAIWLEEAWPSVFWYYSKIPEMINLRGKVYSISQLWRFQSVPLLLVLWWAAHYGRSMWQSHAVHLIVAEKWKREKGTRSLAWPQQLEDLQTSPISKFPSSPNIDTFETKTLTHGLLGSLISRR